MTDKDTVRISDAKWWSHLFSGKPLTHTAWKKEKEKTHRHAITEEGLQSGALLKPALNQLERNFST